MFNVWHESWPDSNGASTMSIKIQITGKSNLGVKIHKLHNTGFDTAGPVMEVGWLIVVGKPSLTLSRLGFFCLFGPGGGGILSPPPPPLHNLQL